MNNNGNTYYYKIILSYEIPINILNVEDLNRAQARDILYETLKNIVPENKYEKFSVKLVLYQLKDTYNYMLNYEAFFRSTSGLPMEEYVEAAAIRDSAKYELENFFNSVDCEYKTINIKTLL